VGDRGAVVAAAQAATMEVSRSKTGRPSRSADGDSLRTSHGNPVGRPAVGDGLRKRRDLLAASARLAGGRHLGPTPSRAAAEARGRDANRLVSRGRRFLVHPCRRRGKKTGPNPTDRARPGSKHHVVTDGKGIPLATVLTGANEHDVTQLIPLIDRIPRLRRRDGTRRRRPVVAIADRAYDSSQHRRQLKRRGIGSLIARRGVEHGSGLGRFRWVVERTHSWLHQNRRLRIRFERLPSLHEAFLSIGCALVCWNHLMRSF